MNRILSLSAEEARKFFLRTDSYFTVPLPEYFDFGPMLNEMLCKTRIGKEELVRASRVKGVNFELAYNKDGKYGQRMFQLIHPALYTELVRVVTELNNWEKIKAKMSLYEKQRHLVCASPAFRVKCAERNMTAAMIFGWWKDVEQESIKMALYYNYMMATDIMECYNSVPLNGLAVALDGIGYRNNGGGLGERLRKMFSAMAQGQEIGVPQGSMLVDFLVEGFLAYMDVLFGNAIKQEHIGGEYTIIRYRDDYRIFTKDEKLVRSLTRILSDVLGRFGMKLNPEKTILYDDIVMAARKPDKIYWEGRRNGLLMKGGEVEVVDIQKELFAISELGRKYPNSGSVQRALVELYKDRVSKLEHRPKDAYSLVALVVDIMVRNPRTYMVGVAILSKIMSFNPGISRKSLAERVLEKARQMPNIDYLEVCLQRLTVKNRAKKKYKNKLSALIYDSGARIWNSEWLDYKVNDASVVCRQKIKKMDFVVPVEEIEIFGGYDEDGFEEF